MAYFFISPPVVSAVTDCMSAVCVHLFGELCSLPCVQSALMCLLVTL